MMGRGRTRHHVAKQTKARISRKGPSSPWITSFMKVKSVPNAQTISEESITCTAVKEDRHQNIMSSVALKIGVEEPWTIERVAKFIDLAWLP